MSGRKSMSNFCTALRALIAHAPPEGQRDPRQHQNRCNIQSMESQLG
jgi:hypothetical protein